MSSAVRAVAEVDLGAMRHNLMRIRDLAGDALVMAVVKANGYGHGMVEVARMARSQGAEWLGVALPSEALDLRTAGDTGPILAWLWAPGDHDVAGCVRAGVDLSVSSRWALDEVVAAARAEGRRADVHVKLDTGLSRNGVLLDDWPDLLDGLTAALEEGLIEVRAIWSHLADADLPGAATVPRQRDRFLSAVEMARGRGVVPALLHLSNSGGLFAYPDCRFDLVRVGIAMYGLTPAPVLGTAADLGLIPAMTLRARLANVKSVAAGTSVSYGSTWTTSVPTTLGLVPVGYADGVPRAAGGRAYVAVDGRRQPLVGRLAMDQFVIDLGARAGRAAGEDVVLFGPGTEGEPTADDWGAWVDTIGYEIVTRIGTRVPRSYVDTSSSVSGQDGT
jgi:alanine racemase